MTELLNLTSKPLTAEHCVAVANFAPIIKSHAGRVRATEILRFTYFVEVLIKLFLSNPFLVGATVIFLLGPFF